MSTATSAYVHPDLALRSVRVGNEKRPVLVVDNLFRNAESLVDFAARKGSFLPAPGYYPGVRCLAPANYGSLFLAILGGAIEECFQARRGSLRHMDSTFSMVTTPREALSVGQKLPHFDKPEVMDLAVVHYLCEPRHGGTAFYRHRATGFESIDQSRNDDYMRTLNEELRQRTMQDSGYINRSSDLFEQTAMFEAAFNRAIIYPSNSLHSGAIPEDFDFDPDPRTGRLTVTSFISPG